MSLKDKLYADDGDDCGAPYDQRSGGSGVLDERSLDRILPRTGKSYGKMPLTEQT
jgi:hypothetical protein